MDSEVPWADRRLRRARTVTMTSLAMNAWTTLVMPGIGLVRESDATWIGLGALGIGVFTVAHIGALYAVVTPWLTRARPRLLVGFAAAAVLSVPLVGPVAAGDWATWAWLGASIVGTVPLLLRPWPATLATVATLAVTVGVAEWTGGSIVDSLLITGAVGLGAALIGWLQVWFWDLLVQAQQGRAAQARLAATRERLRFASDVHDLLGHHLTVIALKAELAARLAPTDAVRAGQEAAEAQRLAAAALTELRAVVHGYREVDLADQVAAVSQVLRSSGLRCTIDVPENLPARAASQLAPVLREASTNVLRHSRAGWCRIEIAEHDDGVRMTVRNDGAGSPAPGPDRHSHGLRGLADRLAEAGGTLRTNQEDGVFTLEATVRVAL